MYLTRPTLGHKTLPHPPDNSSTVPSYTAPKCLRHVILTLIYYSCEIWATLNHIWALKSKGTLWYGRVTSTDMKSGSPLHQAHVWKRCSHTQMNSYGHAVLNVCVWHKYLSMCRTTARESFIWPPLECGKLMAHTRGQKSWHPPPTPVYVYVNSRLKLAWTALKIYYSHVHSIFSSV